MLLRTARRWCTANAVATAARCAPMLPDVSINAIEGLARVVGPRLPRLAAMVRENMKSAGVYSPRVIDDYYFQVARHLSNAIRVFKNRGRPEFLQNLARDQVDLDSSLDTLRSMKSQGRGALLAPAHAVNFLLTAARVNHEVPIRVFLRWSSDVRRLRLKQQWCEACGLAVLLEPGGTVSATTRAEMCVDAIKGGEILLITPDVAQRRDEGVGVELLGRTAYLPTGAAAIAMLAEAPMVPLFSRLEETRQVMYATEPITVPMLSRNEGGRPAALKGAMQQWATGFEAYLRTSPAAWFLWGDSRWTRVFRGDPEYASSKAGA